MDQMKDKYNTNLNGDTRIRVHLEQDVLTWLEATKSPKESMSAHVNGLLKSTILLMQGDRNGPADL